MREEVSQLWIIIPFSWKPNKSLFIQVKLHWPHLRYGYIDSHVPLNTSNEHRVVNVLLENALLIVFQVVDVIYDWDSSTSAEVWRLADPKTFFVTILVEVVDELLILVGQNESQRGKVINLAIELLHLLNYSSKVILGADRSCFGNMAELLILFCPLEFS